MEHRHYRFDGTRTLAVLAPCLVGVVASGNLEVLIEPARLDGGCTVDVATAMAGFGNVWDAVIGDFHDRHRLADVRIDINDNGATPATVSLRLEQAVAEYAAGADADADTNADA
ncbi:MAG TPA: malonate decarboxylase acyl carrier protein [Casimicrobiaceae bacterium]